MSTCTQTHSYLIPYFVIFKMLKIEDFQSFQRSTIPPISTKWTINYRLSSTHWTPKTTTYDVGNPGPGTKMFEFMIL